MLQFPSYYKVETDVLSFNDVELKVSRVTNTDELFERLVQKGDDHEDVKDERIPYWAELWPSAIAMSKYLVEIKNEINLKSVIEIGGGLGLPGLMAAKLGATVIETDYLKDAVDFAAYNANQNSLDHITCETLDWRDIKTEQKFDVVLASDVAYEKRSHQPLIDSFTKLCKNKGVVIITEPNRLQSLPFYELLKKGGFKHEIRVYQIPWKNLNVKVNLIRIDL